jgi:hypothetical protein
MAQEISGLRHPGGGYDTSAPAVLAVHVCSDQIGPVCNARSVNDPSLAIPVKDIRYNSAKLSSRLAGADALKKRISRFQFPQRSKSSIGRQT